MVLITGLLGYTERFPWKWLFFEDVKVFQAYLRFNLNLLSMKILFEWRYMGAVVFDKLPSQKVCRSGSTKVEVWEDVVFSAGVVGDMVSACIFITWSVGVVGGFCKFLSLSWDQLSTSQGIDEAWCLSLKVKSGVVLLSELPRESYCECPVNVFPQLPS